MDHEQFQNKTARDVVYEKLRRAIISGEYLPGQRLVERDLAKKFEVSRTPVREALRKLELERLVTTTAFSGVIVTEYSPEEIKEFFEIRAVLEGLAARSAALHRDEEQLSILRDCLKNSAVATKDGNLEQLIHWNDQFHKNIARASGSEKLEDMINGVRLQINLLRMTSLISRPEQNYEEHESIFWAIKRRYSDVAETLMKHHIMLSLTNQLPIKTKLNNEKKIRLKSF